MGHKKADTPTPHNILKEPTSKQATNKLISINVKHSWFMKKISNRVPDYLCSCSEVELFLQRSALEPQTLLVLGQQKHACGCRVLKLGVSQADLQNGDWGHHGIF